MGLTRGRWKINVTSCLSCRRDGDGLLLQILASMKDAKGRKYVGVVNRHRRCW
jgi:hypothetical protein